MFICNVQHLISKHNPGFLIVCIHRIELKVNSNSQDITTRSYNDILRTTIEIILLHVNKIILISQHFYLYNPASINDHPSNVFQSCISTSEFRHVLFSYRLSDFIRGQYSLSNWRQEVKYLIEQFPGFKFA